MTREVNQGIDQILGDKESQGIKYYFVKKTNSKFKLWLTEDNLPKGLLNQYLKKSHQSSQHSQSPSQHHQTLGNKTKGNLISQPNKYKAPDTKQGKRKADKRKKSVQSQQDNSFMNENQSDGDGLQQQCKQFSAGKRKMPKQVLGEKSCCSQEIVDKSKIFEQGSGSFSDLIAEVSSSSNSQQDEQASIRMGKKTKNKKIKKKTKTLKRPIRGSTKSLDEDNIIETSRRYKERKNYNQVQGNEDKFKSQLKLKNIKKEDYQYIQSLLIATVLSSGMVGSYKYFLVQLRQNNEKVYVLQKHMVQYFPRKLAQFYQRILNRVSKSTHSLNFMF